jgi:hypothetical protein
MWKNRGGDEQNTNYSLPKAATKGGGEFHHAGPMPNYEKIKEILQEISEMLWAEVNKSRFQNSIKAGAFLDQLLASKDCTVARPGELGDWWNSLTIKNRFAILNERDDASEHAMSAQFARDIGQQIFNADAAPAPTAGAPALVVSSVATPPMYYNPNPNPVTSAYHNPAAAALPPSPYNVAPSAVAATLPPSPYKLAPVKGAAAAASSIAPSYEEHIAEQLKKVLGFAGNCQVTNTSGTMDICHIETADASKLADFLGKEGVSLHSSKYFGTGYSLRFTTTEFQKLAAALMSSANQLSCNDILYPIPVATGAVAQAGLWGGTRVSQPLQLSEAQLLEIQFKLATLAKAPPGEIAVLYIKSVLEIRVSKAKGDSLLTQVKALLEKNGVVVESAEGDWTHKLKPTDSGKLLSAFTVKEEDLFAGFKRLSNF